MLLKATDVFSVVLAIVLAFPMIFVRIEHCVCNVNLDRVVIHCDQFSVKFFLVDHVQVSNRFESDFCEKHNEDSKAGYSKTPVGFRL